MIVCVVVENGPRPDNALLMIGSTELCHAFVYPMTGGRRAEARDDLLLAVKLTVRLLGELLLTSALSEYDPRYVAAKLPVMPSVRTVE